MKISEVYTSVISEGWYAGTFATHVVLDENGYDLSLQDFYLVFDDTAGSTKTAIIHRAQHHQLPEIREVVSRIYPERFVILDDSTIEKGDIICPRLWISNYAPYTINIQVDELRVLFTNSEHLIEDLNYISKRYPKVVKILQVGATADSKKVFETIRACPEWVFRETLTERFPILR